MTETQLMVQTKRGAVYFTTSLEWEEAIALCQKVAQGGNKFAYDMCMKEHKGQYMSQSQVSWVYKMAEEQLQRQQEADMAADKVPPREADASNLLASLAEARVKGLKKPTLRLVRTNGVQIRLKYMSQGSNAGGAWVTQRIDGNDDLIGKIDDGGVFTFTSKYYTQNVVDEVFDVIEAANADPKAALESYGRITSNCGCCGLPLTNATSIALGIGPICLEKYGLGV